MTVHFPTPATPFVGRTEELAEISALLSDPACRLLTLVGPGGIGKTRLALEAMQQVEFRDGVFWVALQPLASPELLLPAIAEALQFQFLPGDDQKQQLFGFLGEKTLLLVPDNFEHLLDGADLLSDILAHAAGVKILVTSRERLNLLEEWLVAVEGLRFPAKQVDQPLETYSAVQLFLQRARQVQAKFSLEGEREAVLAICQGVEGMPLGLELAASWMRSMPPASIAAGIAGNLDFLTTPLRNVPDRHRSMRAVFEQSWRLLSGEEQRAMTRLTVFHGGFLAEAAAQVADAPQQMLAGLIDKSLVQVGQGGRYDLHPLVRQYAQEQLTADEARQTAARHSAYYLEWLAHQESSIRDGDYATFVPEIDNLRVAWSNAAETGAWTRMQAAVNSLFWFFHLQNRFEEGNTAFTFAIERLDASGDDQRLLLGCLLLLESNFLSGLRRADVAMAALERGISVWEPLNECREMGTPLAFACFSLNNIGGAIGLLDTLAQRTLALFSASNEHWGTIYTLAFLSGVEQEQGNLAEAHAYMDQAIELSQQQQNLVTLGWTHNSKAILLYAEGRFEEGGRHDDLALYYHQSAGFQGGMPSLLINVGGARLEQRDRQAAFDYFDRAIAVSEELDDKVSIAVSCAWRGYATALLGDEDAAKGYMDRIISVCDPLHDYHTGHLAGMYTAVFGITCGLYEIALQLTERYMDGWIRQGVQTSIANIMMAAGFASVGLGKEAQAATYFREALAKAAAVKLITLKCNALSGIAYLPSAPAEQAIMLAGFVSVQPNAYLFAKVQAMKALDKLESRMDAEAFQNALQRGAELDLAQAVELGEALLDHALGGQGIVTPPARRVLPDDLSQRELDVLRLIAEGLTNAEIAGRLYVGVSTVKKHINHIYDKLGVKTRTQAVARARERQILA